MYKIEFQKPAVKFLRTIPKEDQEKIMQRIKRLIGVIKPIPETYRLRHGAYRIKLLTFDNKLIVEIIDIDARNNTYI